MGLAGALHEIGRNIGRSLLKSAVTQVTNRMKGTRSSGGSHPSKPRPRPAGTPSTPRSTPSRGRPSYPGDFRGPGTVDYRPQHDGDPDPGEIVWAWVPYEEDHQQGKDRPVLIIGVDGPWLLALMLSSKDRAAHGEIQQQQGREWLDIGPGPWDSQGRPSEVRLNRVLRIAAESVRREGAQLPAEIYETVANRLRTHYGWH